MTSPIDFQKITSEDFAGFKEFFSKISPEELSAGFQNMIKTGSNKIKLLLTGDKTETRPNRAITVRFTPEMYEKWKSDVNALHTNNAKPMTAEVSKRASGEFAAAFKDGKILIEVKENGKRVAFASEAAAKNIQNGTIRLQKNGKEVKYDDIKVMDHQHFEDIATIMISHVQSEAEPVAVLSKEAVQTTNQTEPQPVTQQAPTDETVLAAKKTVLAPQKNPRQRPGAVVDKKILEQEEHDIEHDRDILHAKQAEEKAIERQNEKTDVQELKQEELTQELVKTETPSVDPSQDQGSSAPS